MNHGTSKEDSMSLDRRQALSMLAGLLGGLFIVGLDDTEAHQRRPARRAARRRVRRHVRRRIRRRAIVRTVAGRRVWVAPVALAVGWELLLDRDRVVVVKETKIVERDGARMEVAVVQDADGKSEQIEIVREDTPENGRNMKGSALPDDDKTTPATEEEEEVEEEGS
jgi:hypothetical protein